MVSAAKNELAKDPNVFDFTKSEYSAEELIQFFYLITFPGDIDFVEDATDAIMLAHLYAPEIARIIVESLSYIVPLITASIDDLRYFGK